MTDEPDATTPRTVQRPVDVPEEILLADGVTVEVRPIRPGDIDQLVRFHEHLSGLTVYRRFFSIHPHLGPEEATHFCTVDSVDRVALVALVSRQIVGVARMERIQPATTAEVAFVISDEFQHRGLGRVLARCLAVAARESGITDFVADVLPDNHPMLRLLPDAGFAVTASTRDGVTRLVCPIRLGEREKPWEAAGGL